MSHFSAIRAPRREDFEAWLELWTGYNRFYGRFDDTALPDQITRATWVRFFDAYQPMHALVAESQGRLVGLVHYIFHRNTIMLEPTCYLQDLFTDPTVRGQGVGKRLIEAVYQQAEHAGLTTVYWHTHETNTTARRLYDGVATDSGFLVYRHKVG
jgi:GNAT superfamily N-acetyltransferase